MDEQLLTKSDVAKVLGITPAAVVFLERKGLLTATRTRGGVRLFKASEVEALANARDHRRLETLRSEGGQR